jgi:heptosyltransferase-3
VPVLALFGPTNPQRWAPWPALPAEQVVTLQRRGFTQSLGQVTLLQSDLPCVPCGKAGCDNHVHSRADCLPSIRPERVAQEALAMLRQGADATAAASA